MVKTGTLPVSPFCDSVHKSNGYDEQESTLLKLIIETWCVLE